jgi:hypothetical protein
MHGRGFSIYHFVWWEKVLWRIMYGGIPRTAIYEEEYSESLNYDQLFSIYQRTIREKTRSGES